jgi:phosphoribosylformylglycinamidine synthase
MKAYLFSKRDTQNKECPPFYLVISRSTAMEEDEVKRLEWLFDAKKVSIPPRKGVFIGPRAELVTPWSTNATDICKSIGISGVLRVEKFTTPDMINFDPMLMAQYEGIPKAEFLTSSTPLPVIEITNITEYNLREGLALSENEINFLENHASSRGYNLTDCEVYGFAQINSEHCRHKIFNGKFIINGNVQEATLFELIKRTAKNAPDEIRSAYKDNVAFFSDVTIKHFAPVQADKPSLYSDFEALFTLSLKAETHNYPTTVEPFFGASTGSGGEIRDRMAGGTGSMPLAGTAVYMTSFPRLGAPDSLARESYLKPRKWRYQSPQEILIKASNGASDFGNKFGQPLINGSLLTMEVNFADEIRAFDRVVMLAGGVGYAKHEYLKKKKVKSGDLVVVLGGDNYRIGMAGGSVSSVVTGKLSRSLELSAVQRANPEMQKRVYNVVRSFAESTNNPILSIHDHGAGGHVNCLSELMESSGGVINVSSLPVGDLSLSVKELLCNESQERIGLVIASSDLSSLVAIAKREQAPHYVVGEIGDDNVIRFVTVNKKEPFNLPSEKLFCGLPQLEIHGKIVDTLIEDFDINSVCSSSDDLISLVRGVLSLEGVACKEWLTSKVDRSVTGLVAAQQCVGPLQLPLQNFGLMSLDYYGTSGVATAIGSNPAVSLLNPEAGSHLSIAEALTNIVWCPLEKSLNSVVLSANWMWPAGTEVENAKLYNAVQAASEFAQALNISIPTGKDSLSMTMCYEDGLTVKSPGTVVITASALCDDITLYCTPDLKNIPESELYFIEFQNQIEYPLGASSFLQSIGKFSASVPEIKDYKQFAKCFNFIQDLLRKKLILAGHDISNGGLITAVLEMAFSGDVGVSLTTENFNFDDQVNILFSEKPSVVVQIDKNNRDKFLELAKEENIKVTLIGKVLDATQSIVEIISKYSVKISLAEIRRVWYRPSALLDKMQTQVDQAEIRWRNFGNNQLKFSIPKIIKNSFYGSRNFKAAIVREKGSNGERELARAAYESGFEVLDITMTDIIEGEINLKDVQLLLLPGGFSHSDVTGAAKGWAGVAKYNTRAEAVFNDFFNRSDTLSLGVCNGCQFMVLSEVFGNKVSLTTNDSHRFESSFLSVDVLPSNSVIFEDLVGARLGIWVAHGEGKFIFSEEESFYQLPIKYSIDSYPNNPNGSQFSAAAICNEDGRHLAIMPHLERSLFWWQWPYRGELEVATFERKKYSPWITAFNSAYNWF